MEHLEQLMIDIKESLERQITDGFSGLNTGLDNLSTRLDRHAALPQTGNRWSGRMNDWSEKVDTALELKDRQIAELTGEFRSWKRITNDL